MTDAILKIQSSPLFSAMGLALTVAAGLVLDILLWRVLKRVSAHTMSTLDDSFVRHMRKPSRLLFPVVAVYVFLPSLAAGFSALFGTILDNLLAALLTLGLAWLLICSLYVLEDLILRREDLQAKDNLRARKIYTQLQILKRILTAIISLLAIAALLLHYEEFRRLGTSILASAGLVGLVVGFAAQRTLANLLAGFQIALTEPIRLDDVVIVQGEWGWIEEITLTYVVVRIWDLRRLIVPISYFLEKPFENWTRVSADLLGTVFVYSDYSLPVDDLRRELHRILSESEHWDGKVEGVQVTNASEHTLEIRALMSAEDSSKAWDLRCEVREKLISYIRREHPEALPRVRAELHPLGSLSPRAGTNA
jgi:small-conductance mechanosensitive channel